MSQQQAPTPNKPLKQGMFILMWIGIVLFVATFVGGIYTIIAQYNIVFSVISFILAIAAIPIGILQVKPDAFKLIWRTRKTGRLVIGIAILFLSLTMNTYELIQFRPSTSFTGTIQFIPSPASKSPTDIPTVPITPSAIATTSQPIVDPSIIATTPQLTLATATPTVGSPVTTTTSCTDTEYAADFYGLPRPYPQATQWNGWLSVMKWFKDGWPTHNDVLIISANKQGFGPEGYVGVIQQAIQTGQQKWNVTVNSTSFSGGTPITDTHCSNVTEFTLSLSAGTGDGVAFYHQPV
jgi:hypothetical protein